MTSAEPWVRTEWADLKKGDLVRFEARKVALEGRIFGSTEVVGAPAKLRVELYFSSPTMDFLKSNGFNPYKLSTETPQEQS